MLYRLFTIAACILCMQTSIAQEKKNKEIQTPAEQLIASTGEDSLNAFGSNSRTIVSGYGEVHFQRDMNAKQSIADLKRAVLFVGHQFSGHIAFFSELEVEDAKVEGGGASGEVALEQAYLKFSLNPRQYIVAGLFIPRIGIINENHLPVNFNGVERPMVEEVVIPSTWREIGVGFYGQTTSMPLTYSVAVLNGLNNAAFEHGNGFREGRFEGNMASANNLAVTAAVQYFTGNWKFQVSGYMGGTTTVPKEAADTLHLDTGIFGNPLFLAEANVQYSHNGFSFKALGCNVSIPDAKKVNDAFGSNTPEQMYGAYAELGYNLLQHAKSKKWNSKQLVIFGRYETLDLNAKIPVNGVTDGMMQQSHLIAGFGYFPIPNVAVKADVRLFNTGVANTNNTFLNLAVGYSF